jgi:hypothetical protein
MQLHVDSASIIAVAHSQYFSFCIYSPVSAPLRTHTVVSSLACDVVKLHFVRRDKGDVLVCYLKGDLAVNPPMQKMAGRSDACDVVKLHFVRRDKGDVLVCYLKGDLAVNPPMQKMAGRLEDYAAPRLRITMALLL